jgi:2-keto-3-deoxy-L-rhamnonate aldolase RhmA
MGTRPRIHDRLEANDVALGARATATSPTLVEVYGSLGFDFVWVDLEHTGPSADDATALEHLVRAANLAGTELLVRIPGREPHTVRKVLDAGVRTVLVPRVETAAEVRAVVRAGRFVYDGGPGDRGAAAGYSSRWGNPPDGYPAKEDETVRIGVMLENETAVENVDDILAVPELGFVFVGPSDLSISLGHPFETTHPDVLDAIETIRAAAIGANVPLGGIRNRVEEAREAIEDGYQILRIGDEVSAVRSILGPRLNEIRTGD